MISASPPTMDRSEGHGPLLSRPLHESMGKEVIEWLTKHAGMELPARGCLAGQAVMSAILALYGNDLRRQGAVNDLDVFWTRNDGLIEQGWFDKAEEGTLWVRVPDEAYDQIFARKLEVLSGARIGKLNMVQLIAPANTKVRFSGPNAISAIERLDTLLSDFDLSCVEVGVDLASGRMRWTQEFADCMEGAPVIATELAVPERTWLRYLKKQQEMPWLRFDQAQILSTVQFAQAFAYLRVSPGKEMDQRLEGWQRHHELPLATLDPQQLVKPLWNREVWPAHSTVNTRAAHLDQMSWRMTLLDLGVLKTLIAPDLPKHPANLEAEIDQDGPFHKLMGVKIGMEEKFHGSVQPPDRAQIIVDRGRPEQLLELFKADPRAMRARLPAEEPSPRHDLLDHAVVNYKADFVPLLVASGASFLAEGKRCHTIFAEALWMADKLPAEDATNFADKLLSYAPDVGKRNGATLFMDVVQLLNGSDALLKWWVEKGLPVNLPDEKGRTGADVINAAKPSFSAAMREVLGEEAIEKARRKKVFLDSVDVGDLQGMRYSLATGDSPNDVGVNNAPPLVLACYHGRMDAVRLLLSQGAHVNRSDGMNVSPLMVAAREGHAELVGLLLDHGADINATCKEGKTALHLAVEKHQTGVALQLMRSGAPLFAADKSEFTPLDLACTWANTAVIGEYLSSYEPGKDRTVLMNHIRRSVNESQAKSDEEKQEVFAFLLAIEAQEQLRNIYAMRGSLQMKSAA